MRREWLEKDYYAALGVSKTATDDDIRRAYRRLAQKYHPDNNPGDAAAEERFKDINEANAVLGDPELRRQYDEARDMGAFVGGPGGTRHIRIEDFGDVFGGGGGDPGFSFISGLGDLFGGRGRQPQQGADVAADVNLTFHEALHGATKTVATNGARTKVRIPAGIEDRGRVRVRGKGMPGAGGGPNGDLLVRVHVADHPLFKREGPNLRLTVPITFTEAALGAEIDVPTLDGKVTLRIPPGTTSGKTFRVKNAGFTSTKGGRGHLLVTVEVTVPASLSDHEKRLLTELREAEADRNPRAHLGV